jgi:hypothetical protein
MIGAEPGRDEEVNWVIRAGTEREKGKVKEPRSFEESEDSFAGRKESEVEL